jgi:hypothetical protein
MTWLTWRLQRSELILFAAVLIGVGALFAVTYSENASLHDPETWATCLNSPLGPELACPTSGLLTSLVASSLPWINLLPVVAAVLLAFPVVHELNSGAYRLTWTQSLSRSSWMKTKIVALVLSALLFAATLSTAFRWWSTPHGSIYRRFDEVTYDFTLPLLSAHTLFALGLMLCVATLLRRTIPAILIGALAYTAVRFPMALWARPRLLEPEQELATGLGVAEVGGRWWLSAHLVDATGARVSYQRFYENLCPEFMQQREPNSDELTACMTSQGISQMTIYHPSSHYWPLQFIETGMFMAAAALLISFTAWNILRRVE